MSKNKWWWFSFSFEGTNNGCCNVQAPTQEEALQKTIDLNIHPPHDNIWSCEMDDGPELDENKLYSNAEMNKLEYIHHKETF